MPTARTTISLPTDHSHTFNGHAAHARKRNDASFAGVGTTPSRQAGHRGSNPPSPRPRVIGDILADYVEERGPQLQAWVSFEIGIRYLLPYWGERLPSEITEATCHDYYAFRNTKRPMRNSSIGRELRVLRAALNRDYDMGRSDRRIKVWIKREHHQRSQPPTRREVLLMARSFKPGSARRRYTLIGFYTGARKGAVIGLRWSQVYDDRIDFNVPDQAPTNKRRAVIPMHRKLRCFMETWRRAGTQAGTVIHHNGQPVVNLKRVPKTLRGAAAVHMLQCGVSVYDVAKWLGNTVDMIERHYGHYRPEQFSKALEAWDGHRTAAVGSSVPHMSVIALPSAACARSVDHVQPRLSGKLQA